MQPQKKDESVQVFGTDESLPVVALLTHLFKSQRALILDLFGSDRFVLVPEIEDRGDYDANAQAAEKEPAVGGQPDQEDKHQRRGDEQACSASQMASGRFGLRIPFHAMTLPLFYPKK
jgi:hypothetical protein